MQSQKIAYFTTSMFTEQGSDAQIRRIRVQEAYEYLSVLRAEREEREKLRKFIEESTRKVLTEKFKLKRLTSNLHTFI